VKTLTVRLPEDLVADIEDEARRRRVPKSDVIRARLSLGAERAHPPTFQAIADLIGAVDGLPSDMSARRKKYLAASGYGADRPR
jgi:Arc/MetJ-type ribon-helix-helix transcriptional regulator